jgi:hypothetical protein
MTAVITNCTQCGKEHEPTPEAIRRGQWRECPSCHTTAATPPNDGGRRCERCGRPLRTAGRSICLGCLLGGIVL